MTPKSFLQQVKDWLDQVSDYAFSHHAGLFKHSDKPACLFAFGFLRAHLLGGRCAEGESPAGTEAISHRDHHSSKQEDPQARLRRAQGQAREGFRK